MATKEENILVYKGRDLPFSMTIYDEGVAVPFIANGVTKISIEIGDVEYSSDDGYVSYDDAGKVLLKLGSISNPPSKKVPVRLYRYSSTEPNGVPLFTERTNYKLTAEFI